MRRIIQLILNPLIVWISKKFCGAPKAANVYNALNKIACQQISSTNVLVKDLHENEKYIILSDQHKGDGKDGDDFAHCAETYQKVLEHYNNEHYTFINLGDSEELWKFKPDEVVKTYETALRKEAAFHEKGKYIKIYGNHDAFWLNNTFKSKYLKPTFKTMPSIYEAVILKTRVFDKPISLVITHGHQGDRLSENNKRSMWVVAHIWAPFQRYLRINVNTPSTDDCLKHKHNKIMYQWSCMQPNTLLIAGHTHKPVFASGKYSPHLSNYIGIDNPRENFKPSYFNTGSCCNKSGTVTGIEVNKNKISLVLWRTVNGKLTPLTPESKPLTTIIADLNN